VASVWDKYPNPINHLTFSSCLAFDVAELFITGKLIPGGSQDIDMTRQIPASCSRNLSTEMTAKQSKAKIQKCKQEVKRNRTGW